MSTMAQSLTPEANQAIAILRALTLSRKYPASLKELLKEYKTMEGNPMNYRKFGFQSLEDFINASGEFIVNKNQGEICLSAKPSKDSVHISEMVKRQRASKRKGTTPPFRQPYSTDHSWNKSTYSSNVFPRLPSSPTKKYQKSSHSNVNRSSNKSPGDSNNNSNNQNNRNTQNYTKEKKSNSSNQLQQLQQPQQQQQKQSNSRQPNAQMNGKQFQQQTPQMKDMRDKINTQKHQTPTKTVPNISRNGSGNNLQDRLQRNQTLNIQQKVSAISPVAENSKSNQTQTKLTSGQNNNPLPTTNLSNRLQRITNNAIRFGQQPHIGSFSRVEPCLAQPQPQSQSQPTSPVTPEPKSPSPNGKTSIQDRLKVNKKAAAALNGNNGIKQRGDSTSIVSNPTVIDKELNKTKQNESKPTVPPLVFEFNPNLDPVTSLAQYCTVKKYPKPDYKSLKSRFSGLYQCRVLVNGIMYSTYPNEYPSEGVAKIASAVTAIENIKSAETKNRFPMCTDSDVELAMKIFQMLNNHPNGMFCKNIPELFESTFKQTLPDHWISIIQASNQFILEPTAGDNLIVYANLQTSESSGASTASDNEFIILDKITLPWDKKHWSLYITYCASTIEVWARIVGKSYSDQLDSLMNDIDVFMLTDKARPISITCGQIYLVCISECWHRVRVEDMDKAAGNCLCFFIDFGDEEWLAMDQLFICEARFLKLPPQAIPFSLFGLEDFAENPNAKTHLDTMLIGKSLVGEILTKKEVFESGNDTGDDFNAKIQVVLYDTSSNEDVNLNPLLLNKICDDTPPPELKKLGVTNVNITSITPTGEIYLQVRNPGLLYVQKLIHQLVESKFKEDQYKVNEDDMKRSNLFLVQDSDDKRWYRGSLAEGDPKISNTTYNIFYVDYGLVKATNISKIFRLDSLSAALSKFPKQIIKAKLHNIPPVNEAIVARIKGLLPPECPAIVKMAQNAVVPQIIIYRRFDINQGLFNVNEVIRIEYEIENNTILDPPESDRGLTASGIGASRSKNDSPGPGQSSELNYLSNMRAISLKSPITVPSSPQRGDLPKLPSDINIPEIGSLFNVFITMASNPGNFVVQPYDDGPKLVDMMSELQEYCLNNDEFIPVDMLEEGQAYAALNSDGNYHRVTVENILGSSMIHVHYCDFGDIAVLSNDKLKTLPARFRTLPKQAISAKLNGVKPKDGDWTLDDCMRFKELTVGQKFVSVVKNITNDSVSPNVRILELELIDVSTDDDVYIHEILVNESRAIAIPA